MWTRTLALSAGMSLALAGLATAQEPLDRDALATHGFAIANFAPEDAFSPLPDESALFGQAFRITMPVAQSERFGGTFIYDGWHYDRSKGTLRVGASIGGWTARDVPDARPPASVGGSITLGTRNLSNLSTTAQNAYGAEFQVQSIEAQTIAVGPMTREAIAGSVDLRSEMHFELDLAPEAARITVEGLHIVVEGTLLPVDRTRLTLCYDTGASATIDRPLSTLIHKCVLNGRITRVALVSGQGETLQEWLPSRKPR